jgi:transposase
MKKNNSKQKPVEAGGHAEHYRAPLPKKPEGKILGVDCHTEMIVAAVFEGCQAFSAQAVETTKEMGIEEFVEWAAGRFEHDDLLLVEASGKSFHLCLQLQARGLRCAVLESAALARHASPWRDDDRQAAQRIVLGYLTGMVPCVWVPDEGTRERRDLLHCHQRAVQQERATGNELRGFLNQHGIALKKGNLKDAKTKEWVLKQRQWSPLQTRLLDERLAAYAQAARRRKEFFAMLSAQSAMEPLMRRCMKLLGIGTVNAFAALALIGDIGRFACAKSFAAYLGLNPGRKKSGKSKDSKTGVGKGRGRHDMRSLLTQAAQALMRSRRADPLIKFGLSLLMRKGHRNIALAAVARKLAMRIWRVLSSEQPINGLQLNDALHAKMRKLLTDMGRHARKTLGLTGTLQSDALLLCKLQPLPEPASP